ncbi:MAG: HigA family addiction module antidote protein [Treponema sp.]|jgi:addiction module HigA family antidote|nr:HigA family addiction module antidote protein [Treponema sp.]
MPKTAKSKTPGAILQSFIDEYQINPFFLSKEILVNYQTVTNILKEKARITVPMAIRLAQYFSNSPKYWLDIQASSEIDELSADKKFLASIKKIPKAKKGNSKARMPSKAKAGRKKAKKQPKK